MQIASLIGDPVDHSLSPYMHNAAFRHLGLEATYELWPTPLEHLPARVATLRNEGYLGANVTVPHKQAVMPMIDDVSETAIRIGAVNTLIPTEGGLRGDNTDVYGFGRSLADVVGATDVRSAAVVGAGGASRAVLVSLQDAGCEQIVLMNRTAAKAEALASALEAPGLPAIDVVAWEELARSADSADLLINATSIGWHGDELPFDAGIIGNLPEGAIVFDLTYRSTALLRLAEARGLRTVDGLPMLIHQGARAFELWTGQPAPVAVMTQAVRDEQARRA